MHHMSQLWGCQQFEFPHLEFQWVFSCIGTTVSSESQPEPDESSTELRGFPFVGYYFLKSGVLGLGWEAWAECDFDLDSPASSGLGLAYLHYRLGPHMKRQPGGLADSILLPNIQSEKGNIICAGFYKKKWTEVMYLDIKQYLNPSLPKVTWWKLFIQW